MNQSGKISKLNKATYGFMTVLVLCAAIMYWSEQSSVIDQGVVKSAKFPVYAPSRIPKGYRIDERKTKLHEEVFTYTFTNKDKSADIVVTVQPQPENFDMAKLVGNGTINSSITQSGNLYDLSSSNNSQYLLDSGDALIFYTSEKKIDKSTIGALADDMSKQNNY